MRGRVRKRVSLGLGIVLFFCCCFVITQYVTTVCIPYTAKADKINKNLHSDDEDMQQTEVCLIGGSHGLNAFNPNAMWESQGICCYNYCFAGETIPVTKIYLEELFRKRSFRVVVVDLYYIGLADPYFGEKNYAYDILNKLPCSMDKFRYVSEHVHEEVRKEYYFPLNRYHTRWLSLDRKDFERTPDPEDDWQLGQDFHYETNDGNVVHFAPWEDDGKSIPLKDSIESELRELIEVVKAHDAELLLVDIPRCYDDAAPPADWIGDEHAAVNRAREIASEYGVRVLQFDDEELARIGFVPERHMYNKGHMNIEGSEVFSRALAEDLVSHYPLTRYSRSGAEGETQAPDGTENADTAALRDRYYRIYLEQKKERKATS